MLAFFVSLLCLGVPEKSVFKVVVLQRPFRQTPSISDVQIREAVNAYTAKKYPGVEPFGRILLVVDKTNKIDLGKEIRLNVTFPGPKFQTCLLVKLECENAAWVQYCKDKPQRDEKQKQKLLEDKARVEARKQEKREAKAKAAAAAAAAAPNAVKGKKKVAKKKAAKKK